jgi:hypothetical protein
MIRAPSGVVFGFKACAVADKSKSVSPSLEKRYAALHTRLSRTSRVIPPRTGAAQQRAALGKKRRFQCIPTLPHDGGAAAQTQRTRAQVGGPGGVPFRGSAQRR